MLNNTIWSNADITSLQGEKKRKVCKQIKSLLKKSLLESSRICKLVANYKATLVSNRNHFVFVSHRSILMLLMPRLVIMKWCQKNVKGNLCFLVVLNFDLYEFWYLNLSNGHMFRSPSSWELWMYTNANMLCHEIMHNRDNNKTRTWFTTLLWCFFSVIVFFSVFISFQMLPKIPTFTQYQCKK